MSAELRIIDITDAPDRHAQLLNVARLIQGHDPSWVPQLDLWLKRRLSPTNPFFKQCTLKLFVAKRGSAVVGSISALLDPSYIEHRDERTCFFGFFECIDDAAVAKALVDRVAEQARDWGVEQVRGPRNITRVEDVGLTIDGYDTRPPFMVLHHPRSYARLLESTGFVKHHDVLAYDVDLYDAHGQPKPLPPKLARKSAAVNVDGLEIRRVRYRSLNSDLKLAHTCFVEAYRSVPDTSPMPEDQFISLGHAFLLFAQRDMVQIATIHGKAAGFTVCMPELNEAFATVGGRVLPLGWLRFVKGMRRVNTASFKLIGVLPEYRSTGIHARMIEHTIEGVRRAGYRRLEASVIDERNGPMRAVVEGAGLEVYRRFRFYNLEL
ncbi:MAG: GNAT family N-acetyltransferase [Proteobacteria bacterium]|nr:GNAT family N-acetyltransferase [Pseudomonadota bacterium]